MKLLDSIILHVQKLIFNLVTHALYMRGYGFKIKMLNFYRHLKLDNLDFHPKRNILHVHDFRKI